MSKEHRTKVTHLYRVCDVTNAPGSLAATQRLASRALPVDEMLQRLEGQCRWREPPGQSLRHRRFKYDLRSQSGIPADLRRLRAVRRGHKRGQYTFRRRGLRRAPVVLRTTDEGLARGFTETLQAPRDAGNARGVLHGIHSADGCYEDVDGRSPQGNLALPRKLRRVSDVVATANRWM